MRIALSTGLFALAACSGSRPTASSADVNAAAAEAQGDIDTYAANTLAAGDLKEIAKPMPVLAVTPAAGKVHVRSFPDKVATPADVARAYYAFLADRDYAQAYRLWEDEGRAAGTSERAFADGFARYADYHADVGSPGRIEAGAGQRYVDVPITIHATLASGRRPSFQTGTLTLHRTAAIDGATVAQQRWHIARSTVAASSTVMPVQPAAAH